MSTPLLGHLDPEVPRDHERGAGAAAGGLPHREPVHDRGLRAPGRPGWRRRSVNISSPATRPSSVVSGVFGGRMADIVGRCRRRSLVKLDVPWGDVFEPARIEEALDGGPGQGGRAGARRDLDRRPAADGGAREARAATTARCSSSTRVTSLGGVPVEVDGLGGRRCYSGTQKCLSCPPGLAPLTLSPRALEA